MNGRTHINKGFKFYDTYLIKKKNIIQNLRIYLNYGFRKNTLL